MRSNIDAQYEPCQDRAPMNNEKIMNQSPSPSAGLADALVTTSFATMAVINKLAAENDLSLSMIRVLGILWDRRPRMTELADYLGLEKQTMSGLIARAEKRGLVMRAPNEQDGRATDVFLTSDGIRLVKQIHSQGKQALAPLMAGLSPEEQQQLQQLLQRLLATRQT